MLFDVSFPLTSIDLVLAAMKQSEHQFYLTGSRYFGNYEDSSDWDFATYDNMGVETFLINMGFKVNKDVQSYIDPMTTKVLTKYFCDCEENKKNHNKDCLKIDVQLCKDLETKLFIRDIIKDYFGDNLPESKLQREILWRLIYDLLRDRN